ncbi:MAG: transcription elongation factor GreB [Myxococcales bacterium]|nr:transcription elongation factor GreB [Myxococcales bacterium]
MTAPVAPYYITPVGIAALRAEYRALNHETRPHVVQEVADAAAMGDRSENAEYIYGKRRLREIDRRLGWLEERLQIAVVIDPAQPTQRERAFFGALVTIEPLDADGARPRTLQIVGQDEVDVDAGRISHLSPIGRALLGKRVDDEVAVQTPGGVRTFVVAAIGWQAE